MTAFADPVLAALVEALERAQSTFFVVREVAGRLGWVYVSATYASLVGRTPAEVMAQPFLERVVGDQRGPMSAIAQAFVSGGDIPTMLEFKLAQPHGEPLRLEALMVRHRTDTGAVGVMMVRDPRAASSPTQLNLLEADRVSLVGALAAGFAHEINNPLTSMLLNLRSLRKQVLAHVPEANRAAALRCVDDITTGAERIGSNVRAFQTLATRSDVARLDLAAVVTSALRLTAPTLEGRALVVKRILPVRAVVAEESRVGQAVLAMLLYAHAGFDEPADAMATPQPAHRIAVVVEDRGADVVVEIADNGRVPADDELRHAFDPFVRGRARRTGVGVGLGVARSVAATLGGEVAIARGADGGVITTMRVPAAGPAGADSERA